MCARCTSLTSCISLNLEQATILLAANLAFLSVPNTILFDNGGTSDTSNTSSSSSSQHELVSPAAILSYCSMISSTGSMIIGLLLIRQHRGEEIMDNPRTVGRL